MKSRFLFCTTLPVAFLAVMTLSCGSPKPETTSTVITDPSLQPGLSANLVKKPDKPSVNIDNIDGAPNWIYGRGPVHISQSQNIGIHGWAVDQASAALPGGVDIVIDGKPWQASLGAKRTDVANALNNPAVTNSGFDFHMLAGAIPRGEHTVTVRVISQDKSSYYETGPFTLIID